MIVKSLNEYINSIIDVINELESLLSLFKENSTHEISDVIETKIDVISAREALADEIALKLLVEISEGAFFTDLRENFLELIRNADDIADYAKKSSQILARTQLDWIIRKLYRMPDASLSDFLSKIIKSTKTLKEAFQEMDKNIDHVIERAIKVKEMEEEADDVKWKLLKVIFSYKSEIDVLTLLELKDFLLTLDEISDAAARSSEALIKIATKVRA